MKYVQITPSSGIDILQAYYDMKADESLMIIFSSMGTSDPHDALGMYDCIMLCGDRSRIYCQIRGNVTQTAIIAASAILPKHAAIMNSTCVNFISYNPWSSDRYQDIINFEMYRKKLKALSDGLITHAIGIDSDHINELIQTRSSILGKEILPNHFTPLTPQFYQQATMDVPKNQPTKDEEWDKCWSEYMNPRPQPGTKSAHVRRVVFAIGDVSPSMANDVINHLQYFDSQSHDPIFLIVCSYGGCAVSVSAMVEQMRLCDSPIVTVGVGKIMSAGAIMVSAGEPGMRLATANTGIMYHSVVASTDHSDASMYRLAEWDDYIVSHLIEVTGKTEADVRKDIDRDLFQLAPEAAEYGLIDHVITDYRDLGMYSGLLEK